MSYMEQVFQVNENRQGNTQHHRWDGTSRLTAIGEAARGAGGPGPPDSEPRPAGGPGLRLQAHAAGWAPGGPRSRRGPRPTALAGPQSDSPSAPASPWLPRGGRPPQRRRAARGPRTPLQSTSRARAPGRGKGRGAPQRLCVGGRGLVPGWR